MTDFEIEEHEYDVLVIGAGGAGLRAAIESMALGCKTAVVCKSLFGKAHTVMAEGGMAAAMGNVYSEDNWKVHFRDTMRGGKMLNNWRMAQIHAEEAPDRVLELEEYGALFDRTEDGLILQRDFGGHKYARLAHVGDSTGLEMIRTEQQKAASLGVKVFAECTINRLILDKETNSISGAIGYWREKGNLILFKAKAIILATGGLGKMYAITSNSWEGTGDGHAMAMMAGAEMVDMEFVQFHPTGMVWPPSVKGILVTEGVRGDGGTLRNSTEERFMFNYIPEMFAAETASSEEEADAWYDDHSLGRRTPDLLPRDEVARAINSEVKAGRGSPHGGVFLDIASRRSAEYIQKRLPSMYHQFMQLAGVDITSEPMEVGPTCHYAMGGIKVDAETEASSVDGLFAAGEVAGGLHGANRLGGNSLSDLVVFGRRAGKGAAEFAKRKNNFSVIDKEFIDTTISNMMKPFENEGGDNPYAIHKELQDSMQSLAGIIRTEDELIQMLNKIDELREKMQTVTVDGNRWFNPGWHLALDLEFMLTNAECLVRAAIERKESRGGHTRDDYPQTSPELSKVNFVLKQVNGETQVESRPLEEMPEELKQLFEDD